MTSLFWPIFFSISTKFKGSSLSCANRHFVVVGNHFKTVGRAYLMWCSSIIMGKPKKVSRVFFTKIICRFSADVLLTNMKRDNFRYYLNLRYCEKATKSVKFKFWNQCFSDLRSIRKNICNIRGLRLPIKWTHSKILVKYSVQNLSDETHSNNKVSAQN